MIDRLDITDDYSVKCDFILNTVIFTDAALIFHWEKKWKCNVLWFYLFGQGVPNETKSTINLIYITYSEFKSYSILQTSSHLHIFFVKGLTKMTVLCKSCPLGFTAWCSWLCPISLTDKKKLSTKQTGTNTNNHYSQMQQMLYEFKLPYPKLPTNWCWRLTGIIAHGHFSAILFVGGCDRSPLRWPGWADL